MLCGPALRALPEKLELQSGTAAWNERLIGALQGLDAKQRERMVDELVGASREMKSEDLKARAVENRKRYDQWAGTAAKLVADLNEVDQLLAAGYSLDERPARDRPAAREILERWQKQELFASDAIQAPLAPLIAPIRVLERADGQTLVQIAAAAEHRLGLRVMAWRNLAGATMAWPAEREDLQQALGISDSLAAAVEKYAPQERRELLKTEVGRATARLWNRFVAKASKADDIGFAMRLGEKLAIPVEMLDSRTRFNLAVYDARRVLEQSADEKATGLVIASLAAAIDGLPARLRGSHRSRRRCGRAGKARSGLILRRWGRWPGAPGVGIRSVGRSSTMRPIRR